jgi:hypothetical protein
MAGFENNFQLFIHTERLIDIVNTLNIESESY